MAENEYRRLSCGGCGLALPERIKADGFPSKKQPSACSDKCKAMARRKRCGSHASRACACCGAVFSAPSKAAIYCSRACKVRAWRAANPERLALYQAPRLCAYYARHCVDCGKAEGRRRPWSRCDACTRSVERRQSREWAQRAAEAIHRAAGRVKLCDECGAAFCPMYGYSMADLCDPCSQARKTRYKRANRLRRKALQRGAQVETVDPIKVFERDKWRCHLCGGKTPRAKRGTYSDDAPELDHLLPLSQGGAHAYTNVACACRRCNAAKGATARGQLLLVG